MNSFYDTRLRYLAASEGLLARVQEQQMQAMFLENVSGFAERILRNFDFKDGDSAFVISLSGCNVVPVEIAEEFQKRGVKVVALIS